MKKYLPYIFIFLGIIISTFVWDLIKFPYDSGNLINGFALDVYSSEPVKEDFYKEISNSMNCILTPHTSGVTTESNVRVSQFIAEKTISFLEN